MGEPGTLIKFGRQDHLLQLQEEGLLYMNDLPYFWAIEDEELRGDPFDCNVRIERGPKIGLSLPDGKEVFLNGTWTLGMQPSTPERINLFCMYALRPLVKGSFPVEEKNFRFGECALVLTNCIEFLLRIESTVKSQGIIAKTDFVEYLDDSYKGELDPFKKLGKFAYQSEWRLVCLDGTGGPREIRIGSIRDISFIVRSEEINKAIMAYFGDF